MPPAVAARLQALARQEDTTLYTVLLAAFQTLLHRYTSKTWVTSPVSGRTQPRFAGVVGYLVNPVIFRGNLSGAPTSRDCCVSCARSSSTGWRTRTSRSPG